MKFQNTDSIFNVIGDYPVVDQFDVLYSNLMSGSIYDNYITGSLLTKINVLGADVYASGERGLTFSKLGVDQGSIPSVKSFPPYSFPSSYEFQPWRERAGNIRNVRIFSDSERFYDSLTPSITETIRSLSGSISFWLGLPIVFLGSSPNPPVATPTSPVGFEQSFPFEPIFSSVKRTRRFSEAIIATTDINNSTISPVPTKNLYIVEFNDTTRSSVPAWPAPGSVPDFVRANFWIDRFNPPLSPAATEADTIKVLFGFGDRNTRFLSSSVGGPETPYGTKYLASPRAFGEVFNSYYVSISPVIRGWKYGLIDGNPHYTSAVFRRDRFGQLRDMLEQRRDSSVINDHQNSPIRYSGNVETPALPLPSSGKSSSVVGNTNISINKKTVALTKGFVQDPPVKVGFVRETIFQDTATNRKKLMYVTEKPVNTWSSNLSTYATSSLPYFDGAAMNRSETSTIPASLVVTTLADAFGNTIITP